MSSDRDGQLIVFICDNCDEEYKLAGGDFKETWEAAKADGWRCFKNKDDQWEHRCPDCRGK